MTVFLGAVAAGVGELEYTFADLDGIRCQFGLEGLAVRSGPCATLRLPAGEVNGPTC